MAGDGPEVWGQIDSVSAVGGNEEGALLAREHGEFPVAMPENVTRIARRTQVVHRAYCVIGKRLIFQLAEVEAAVPGVVPLVAQEGDTVRKLGW